MVTFLKAKIQPKGYNNPVTVFQFLEGLKSDMRVVDSITAEERFKFPAETTRHEWISQQAQIDQLLSDSVRLVASHDGGQMKEMVGPPKQFVSIPLLVDRLVNYNEKILWDFRDEVTYRQTGKPLDVSSMTDGIDQLKKAYQDIVGPMVYELRDPNFVRGSVGSKK